MSSKRDPKLWIEDILLSIQEIEDTLCKINQATFLDNHTLVNAVSFDLLKISEGVKHLLETDMELPTHEPWKDIYNLGNRLRHAYFGIDRERIWLVAKQDLPSLKHTCQNMLKTLP